MTNQLITYQLPIDYSLISLMPLISYAWQLQSLHWSLRLIEISPFPTYACCFGHIFVLIQSSFLLQKAKDFIG